MVIGIAAVITVIGAAALFLRPVMFSPTPAIASIAVLPFAGAQADPTVEELADGLRSASSTPPRSGRR